MIGPALLLLLQAAAPAAVPAPDPEGGRDIVVTGRRLSDTERAWKACIARNCPPDQEADAALAHAENQFVDGRYLDARATLRTTLDRVKGQSGKYPVAVGDLFRANARIAGHLGLRDPMRIGQFASVDALKAGLPEGDSRILYQRLEVADTFVKQDRYEMAMNGYAAVEREAKRRGLVQVRGAALLRRAILTTQIAQTNRSFAPASRRALAVIAATAEPELQPYREAAALLAAQASARDGDLSGVERIVARYAANPTATPMLVYAPPLRFEDSQLSPVNGSTIERRTATNYDGQWADVGFRIAADGTVHDVDTLRASETLDGRWLDEVKKLLVQRRYAPVRVPAGSDGVQRVERYTLTSFKTEPTGSRLRSATVPRIEMLDLSPEPTTLAARG